MRSIYHHVL